MKDIEKLIRKNIASLCPYSTARDDCKMNLGVFLDANESPFQNGWNRYPDPHQKALKARISEIKGVPQENIFLGNGSDEAIDLVFRVFCECGRDNVVAISPSYGMYGVCAAINDVEFREVLLDEGDFSLSPERILGSCDGKTKVIFLCSPNNPTANAFPPGQILSIASSFDGIVVIDEAYAQFSRYPSLIPQAVSSGNIVVLQTLSKAYGMAALRLGMAFSSERIISLMSMVKYPYNINLAAQKLALELLEEPVDSNVSVIKGERVRLSAELERFPFIEKIWPSDANFLLVRTSDADALYNYLVSCGIIVRNRNRAALCKGCLRITIGLPEENDKLLQALENYA